MEFLEGPFPVSFTNQSCRSLLVEHSALAHRSRCRGGALLHPSINRNVRKGAHSEIRAIKVYLMVIRSFDLCEHTEDFSTEPLVNERISKTMASQSTVQSIEQQGAVSVRASLSDSPFWLTLFR